MEKRKEFFAYLGLFVVFTTLFLAYFSKFGDPIIDCGREAFIPYRMVNGEVLFRDIFCIYGALPYIVNAFTLKLFGVNLGVLYSVGGFLAFSIVSFVYAISREFLSRPLSFTLALFVITVCVFNTSIFNFIFPYSYAMLWALLGFLASLLFLLKYLKNGAKKYAALSMLFWGLSLSTKYEFLPFGLSLLLVFSYFSPLKKPKELLVLLWVFVFPLLTFLLTLFQGASVRDVLSNSHFLNAMLKTDSLKYFYQSCSGMYPKLIPFLNTIFIFLKNALVFFVFAYLFKTSGSLNKKPLRVLAFLLTFVALFGYALYAQFTFDTEFNYLPMFLTVLLVYSAFKNRKDARYLILLLSAVLASVKNFFYLGLFMYGTYPMVILLVALVVSLSRFLKNKGFKNVQKLLAGFFATFAIASALYYAFPFIKVVKYPVVTPMGRYTAAEGVTASLNEAVEWIGKNTTPDDSFIVLPQGQFINFLTDRKSSFYYDSLMPLYIETFGEDRVIEDFKRIKPKYVFITNEVTAEYKAAVICKDYGVRLCGYIFENYVPVAAFGDTIKFRVFKAKR